MSRWARRAALIVAAVATAGITTTAAASAAQPHTAGGHVAPNTYGTFNNSVWANNVNIRSGPGTGYSSNGQAQIGQVLVDYCYTTGTVVNGNPFWDRIHDNATGVNGYVTEYYLNDQSQVKHC